ncbi:SPFH domain-containing protein [candidate division CSSED10-310 bacterium]|uniref:SPFH domain-containing protein n=1 Tax=candidate division CSSED10-310 bacterium TaxID=2855610 RepID=A0ABV6YVA3_UNCC1
MMKAKQRATIIPICCILMLLLILPGCIVPRTTGPNEVGVLVVKWNPLGVQGVVDKFYPEGTTNFFVPLITEWRKFSSKRRNIEMTLKAKTNDDREREDLLFKTIDGNDLSLDVIITYNIIKEKAPYILKYIATNDEQLELNIVRTISRSKPRDIFGELTTEEFYVAENRLQKAQKVKEVLNNILQPYGIEVTEVRTKDYRYNPSYQNAIEQRKIADQRAEQNKAAARAAEQEYKRKIEEAIGEVNKMTAEVDGKFLRGKIDADAYFIRQGKIAQAIEVEGRTDAEALKKMTEALAGPGGENLVKMKVAEALKDKNILLLPLAGGGLDLKTTDVNRLLEVYGLQKAKETKAATPLPPAEQEP